MAIASRQASQILAQPLFHRPNLLMHPLNYLELTIVTCSYKLCHLRKATQGNAASRFALFTAILVHTVASPSLTAMKLMSSCDTYTCKVVCSESESSSPRSIAISQQNICCRSIPTSHFKFLMQLTNTHNPLPHNVDVQQLSNPPCQEFFVQKWPQK